MIIWSDNETQSYCELNYNGEFDIHYIDNKIHIIEVYTPIHPITFGPDVFDINESLRIFLEMEKIYRKNRVGGIIK